MQVSVAISTSQPPDINSLPPTHCDLHDDVELPRPRLTPHCVCLVHRRIKGLRANQRAKHEMEECERRRLKCPNLCGKKIQARSMREHLKDACVRRFVTCTNGCGKPVRFNEMGTHIVDHCGKRTVNRTLFSSIRIVTPSASGQVPPPLWSESGLRCAGDSPEAPVRAAARPLRHVW